MPFVRGVPTNARERAHSSEPRSPRRFDGRRSPRGPAPGTREDASRAETARVRSARRIGSESGGYWPVEQREAELLLVEQPMRA